MYFIKIIYLNYIIADCIIQQKQGGDYMGMFEFDGEKYKRASKHQKEWGKDLISQLSLKGNEIILDLGCGDGSLAEQLSTLVPNGKVIGIDSSSGMIKTAQKIERNNLIFLQLDINEMFFTKKFDIIFSNATLHWIKDHKKLLQNSFRALKTDGVILWDFAATGNCANFFEVIRNKISEEKYVLYFKDFEWPWFMPSKSQYEELISDIGFSDTLILEVNRDRYFSSSAEMIKWIDQPSIVPFIKQLPDKMKGIFRQEVIEEMLKRTQQENGTCFETFRRIQLYAVK